MLLILLKYTVQYRIAVALNYFDIVRRVLRSPLHPDALTRFANERHGNTGYESPMKNFK
jgi:hypothetical protein